MRIAVIGAGSFGTALAKVTAENGHDVLLWSHSQDTAETIRQNRENSIYLKGIPLPENIGVTTDFGEAIAHAELLISATPTQVIREVYTTDNRAQKISVPVVVASKGIEKKTHLLVCDIFQELFGEQKKSLLFFLSGPSFAREMALRLPTAITIAGYDTERLPEIQKIFHNEYFRAYATTDVVGVELGGALKNVLAIATGISDGLGLGNNARAALITRGLAEMARLGERLGARPITFMGLAGMGDLVLTCTGELSRNRSVGLKLAQGKSLAEIQSEMRMVAEGVPTTESAYELAERLGVEIPITTAVYRILYQGMPPQEAIRTLMARSLKFE
ncbi:MAG: NAD(P)-dependent glycerol-3-phosphate dehydrogenase [Leptospiraceae bacterium]|nr:NAD(P)-dependent glycerol-3-phosphate dehydrogenase [Leptospiraceae bacterium]